MAIKFNLPESAYQPGGITIVKSATEKEARREYQRLRRIALKRIDRLLQSEYKAEYIAAKGRREFPKSSELVSVRALSARLGDLRYFLESRQSSVTGWREIDAQIIETLHKHGFEFVNQENLKDFKDFMDAARLKAGGKLASSDRVAELYEQSVKKQIPSEELFKDFKYWVDNVKELKKSRRPKPGGDNSAEAYKERIEKRKAKRARKK